MFWGWDLQGSPPDVQNTFKTTLPIKNNRYLLKETQTIQVFLQCRNSTGYAKQMGN